VVKIACIAQLVNVIAPIMTEKGGSAWRQTIYYPYQFASLYGRGTALDLNVDCPGYDSKYADNVSYLDISGVHNDDGMVTFFAVNRHGSETLEAEIAIEGFAGAGIADHQVIRHDDLRAVNTAKNPDNVRPEKGTGAALKDGKLTLSLAPYSYHMVRIKV
jgi:alpha-N-arabinofuranosidase